MACSEGDYQYLREVVLIESANIIEPSRNALFDARLMPLARRAGVESVERLVSILRVDQTPHLQRAVAEAMTVNETSFFRDPQMFEAVRTQILPRLVEARQTERRLRMWCGACSTGQEVYSLAMLLLEHFPELRDWDIRIIGTDLSRHVVDSAKRGRYRRLEVNRGLSAGLLSKYFERDGDEWQVVPRVRQMCDFGCVNLCATLPSLPLFDLVLLRNVLLYFPQPDRGCVFSDVYRLTRPDGYLVLGQAEQAEGSTNLFRPWSISGCEVYQPVTHG